MPRYDKGKGRGYLWLRAHMNYAGDNCLIWPYSRLKIEGYGYLGHNGEIYRAHRLMCIMVHGEPPSPKHHAAHNCGNGHLGCVNPLHLEWKTVSENQKDRRRHGSYLGGIGSRTRLSEFQISEIRRLSKAGMTQHALAAKFNVKRGCIQYWIKDDDPPAKPGTSISSIYRRQKKAA